MLAESIPHHTCAHSSCSFRSLGAGKKQIQTNPHLVLQMPLSQAPVNPEVSSSRSRYQEAEETTLAQPRPNRPDCTPPSLPPQNIHHASPRSSTKGSVIFTVFLCMLCPSCVGNRALPRRSGTCAEARWKLKPIELHAASNLFKKH